MSNPIVLAAIMIVAAQMLCARVDAAGSACDRIKLNAAGKMAAKKMLCHSRATSTGQSVNNACLTQADDVLSVFAKAESKMDCVMLGDRQTVAALIDRYLATLTSALRLQQTANGCSATKLNAAGRSIKNRLRCKARDLARGSADPDCPLKANAKLATRFTSAEQTQQPCFTGGDQASIASLLNELVGCLVAPSSAVCQAMNAGTWGGLVTLRRQGLFVTPVHATLMRDGRVLFFGYAKSDRLDGDATTQYYLSFIMPPPTDPGTGVEAQLEVTPLVEAPRQANESVWCAGHAPDAAGAVFTAGGTGFNGLVPAVGLPYAQVFSLAENVWSRLPGDPDMKGGDRWYPAVTKLPPLLPGASTPMLVTTGLYTVNENDPNNSVEIFDPSLGDYRLLSTAVESPAGIAPKDYTHVFLLPAPGVGGFPGDEVLMVGRSGDVFGFNYSSTTLSGAERFTGRAPRPSDRQVGGHGADGTSSVMLGDGRVVVVGGAAAGALTVQQDLLRAIDIYDPATDTWRQRLDSGFQREDAATVLLPDGRVLVINGIRKTASAPDPIPQLIDATIDPPVITDGPPQPSDPFPGGGDRRGYHNVALLLPDARVLIGGGRDNLRRGSGHWERPDITFFYPYPAGPRPVIGALTSTEMTYGQPFDIPYSGGPIAEVALIALGAMTHAIDMNQRHVALTIAGNLGGMLRVIGPTMPFVAPPGDYMLFLIGDDGIPSVARIITVS